MGRYPIGVAIDATEALMGHADRPQVYRAHNLPDLRIGLTMLRDRKIKAVKIAGKLWFAASQPALERCATLATGAGLKLEYEPYDDYLVIRW